MGDYNIRLDDEVTDMVIKLKSLKCFLIVFVLAATQLRTQNDLDNKTHVTRNDMVATVVTIIEDGANGNIAVDEALIYGPIQKEKDTNSKKDDMNDADRKKTAPLIRMLSYHQQTPPMLQASWIQQVQ